MNATCEDCKKQWTVTPTDDWYTRSRDGKQVCFDCLRGDLKAATEVIACDDANALLDVQKSMDSYSKRNKICGPCITGGQNTPATHQIAHVINCQGCVEDMAAELGIELPPGYKPKPSTSYACEAHIKTAMSSQHPCQHGEIIEFSEPARL